MSRARGRSAATSRSSTGAGSRRSRASSTATRTRASPATASRSSRCARAGASYEELHARGGGILSTVRATREAGEAGLAAALARARRLDAPRRNDDVRGEVGLRARPRDGARAAPGGPRRGRRSRRGSARTPCRPSSPSEAPTRTSTSCSPTCSRRPPRSPRRPTSSSSAARSTPTRRGATSSRAATPGSRCACTATSSRRPVRSRSRSSSARAPSTTSRRPGPTGSRRSPRSDVVGVLLPGERALPGPADAAWRARSSTRARRSRSRPTSTPAARSARACRSSARSPRRRCRSRRRRRSPRARSTPRTSSGAPSARAASRPGFDADVVLVAADDWRHLAYHLGGPVVHTVIAGGKVAWTRLGIIGVRWPRRSSAGGARRGSATTYVWVDDDGNEVEPDGRAAGEGRTASSSASRFEREPQAPSWQRTLRRGAIFAPIMFGTVFLLSPDLPDCDQDHADAAHRRDLHPVQLLHRPVLLPLGRSVAARGRRREN